LQLVARLKSRKAAHADPVAMGAIRPVGRIAGVIAWRLLEPPAVNVNDIAVLANVIF
jgi:hypothetical protein